jgi:Cu(I)/Ag(I) efflux system membrane fusion protein
MGMHANSFAQADQTVTMAPAENKGGEQTLTLVVPGICEMCKARIESTAMDVPGVKKAEWDMKTDTLVLVGSSKMNLQRVADALAKAGYRSDLAVADPKGYSKLPACCQYDSGAKKH